MKLVTFSIAVAPHLLAGLMLAAYGASTYEAPRAPSSMTTTTSVRIVTVHAAEDSAQRAPRETVWKPARTLTMRLEHGEHDTEGHPNTWVHIPATRDAPNLANGDLRLTFIFHGFKNCIESYTSAGIQCSPRNNVIRPGYKIAEQLERAGSRSIVVVPETSFDVFSAEAPTLSKPGAFRAYVTELLAALEGETGGAHLGDVKRLALAASSGGYEALEPILDDAQSLVTDVLLLDAGYMYPKSVVGRYLTRAATELAEGSPVHRLGIIFTPKGGALTPSVELRRVAMHILDAHGAIDRGSFRHLRGDPTIDDLTRPVYVVRVDEEHDVVVRRNLGRVIASSGM